MANSKDVAVAGVATGIGWGTCKDARAKRFRVFGCVRKPVDADRVTMDLIGEPINVKKPGVNL